MNRDIKFRAWDGEKIRDDFLLSADGEILTSETIPFTVQTSWKLLRYTGLKDKNGKEIYEGYIIIGRDYKDRAGEPRIVEYSTLGFHVAHLPIGMINKCEVIGNIYEHPELLKETSQ